MKTLKSILAALAKEQTDGDVVPTNNAGGTVAPQGYANLFEWMNAQVLTAPEITNPRW